jgi:hypothetical protein
MEKGQVFYSLGNTVITQAIFCGFAKRVDSEECSHITCGAIGVHAVCQECGRIVEKRERYFWKKQICSQPSICKGKLGEPQKSKKAKCKMLRFQTLTDKEICNPEQEIKYALVEITISGRTGQLSYIVDLNNKKFLPTEMKVVWNGKTKRFSARPTDKRDWSKFDIAKVENSLDVIGKILG